MAEAIFIGGQRICDLTARERLDEYAEIFTGNVDESVQNWLEEHPEATTSVADGSLTYKKLVNGTLGYVTPQMYGAKADGTTDDTDAIQNAINNSNFVLFENGIYKISRTIRIHSGLILKGKGAATTIRADVEVAAFSSDDTADIFDVAIDGLGFIGNVILNDASEYPKRGSEFADDTKHGIVVGISLTGSASKRTQRTHSVKRVTVQNCVFKNIYSLPVILNGCENEITICNNYFDNCMDVGIIDCENVHVCRNAIIRSRDNGVSISSGNKNIVCTDNVILYSCFNGIWASGWMIDGNVYAGPNTTIISNNIIKYCGNSAIMAKMMPQNIVISNNYIESCYLSPLDRDTTSKENGNGIFVSGNSADIAEYSNGIFISGNTFSNCARNAIYMQYCRNFKISNNIFKNIGSSESIDGSVITTGETVEFNSLLYILNNDANIISNGELINNSIYDTRNVQVICLSAWCIGSSGIYVYGNIYHNGLPLFEVKTSRNATNVNRFSPSEFNYLINPTVFNYTSSTGDHEIPVTLSAGQMLLITSVSLSTAGKLNMWFVNYTSSSVGYEIINSVSNDSASTLTVNDGKLIYTNTYGRVVAVRYLGMPVAMD